MRHGTTLSGLVLAAALAGGCAGKAGKGDTAAKPSDPAPASPQDGGKTDSLAIASNAAEVNLSASLAVNAPKSVEGDGGGVAAGSGQVNIEALTAGLRSREACELRNKLKRTREVLHAVAAMVCDIEVESDVLAFGHKYAFARKDDGARVGVFIDNAQAGRLTYYACENGAPTVKVTVTGLRKKRSKGELKIIRGDDTHIGAIQGRFDGGFTDPGRIRVGTKSYFKATNAQGTAEFAERLTLNLAPRGVSVVAAAEAGVVQETGGAVHYRQQSGFARIGRNFGQALVFGVTGSSESGLEDATPFGYRGTFDNAGNVLERDASVHFADGARLSVAAAELPRPLSDKFRIDPFGGDDWDCKDTKEVQFSGDHGSKHKACDALRSPYVEEECEDDGRFAYGVEEVTPRDKLTDDDDAAFNYDDDGVIESEAALQDEFGVAP